MKGGNDVNNTLIYQQVTTAAEAPLSDALQGGAVNPGNNC